VHEAKILNFDDNEWVSESQEIRATFACHHSHHRSTFEACVPPYYIKLEAEAWEFLVKK
jgi:hypothetical protein